MDEVLEKLEITNITPNADEKKSNFDGLYKNWGKLGNQEQRRKDILETQKGNRCNKLDQFRGILELVHAVEEREIFHNYRNTYRPSIYVAGFTRTSFSYKNVLMMSEWMIEKPEDFEENWYVVPCPKGVRVLVVASQGTTKCYTKYGHFKFECRTALPGGNRCQQYRDRCCVLDGFIDEKTKTIYVLDLLAWNAQPMTDGETEFRHYWMKTQLEEIPGLKEISKANRLIFKILPKVPCMKESLNEFMMKYPPFENNEVSLDGLLFYHKRAHYFAGETPLVGWLFPYMVPEIIGSDITVDPEYLATKPAGYVNQAEFIQKFEEKYMKKNINKSRRRNSSMMDTVELDDDSNNPEDSKTEETMEATDINPTTLEDIEAAATKLTEESMEATDTTQQNLEGGDTIQITEDDAKICKENIEPGDVKPSTDDMEAESDVQVTKGKKASKKKNRKKTDGETNKME